MNKIPRSRMVAVMRRNGEKAREYAMAHNVPNWYDDADKLLADPEVNTVYIATPPDAHLELTRKAAAAGKPVYVEKPMARTHRECMEMIEVCKQAGVPLFVAYYRRMLPNYRKIMELVENDTIGEVRHVQIRLNKAVNPDVDTDPGNWRVDPDQAGGGYFYDLASHQLDFLDYLLGSIVETRGFSANQAGLYKAEDIVTGSFRFESGVLGTGSWCFTSGRRSEVDEIVITGSRGEISYPTFEGYHVDLAVDGYMEKRMIDELDKDGDREKASETSKRGSAGKIAHYRDAEGREPLRFRFEIPEHIQQPLIETIVGQLLGEKEGDGRSVICPSTGVTAARTNLVMEQLCNAENLI